MPPLGLAHDSLVAETAIAAQQGRPQVARQAIEQRPQARRAVLGRMFVARTDVDIENKTCRGHRVGVIAMARTSRLLGVVAQDRSFLMAIERLDRRIDVEDPRLGQKRLHTKCKMPAQPRRAFLLLDRLEGPADRILADDLAHAEQLRKDSVAGAARRYGRSACDRPAWRASPSPQRRASSVRWDCRSAADSRRPRRRTVRSS